MSSTEASVPALPIGFARFCSNDFINYQLNRIHALGLAATEELAVAGAEVRRTHEVPRVLGALADRADHEGRLWHATGYTRAVEFFAPPGSPDRVEAYRAFLDRFARASADLTRRGLARFDVPYRSASLPVYRWIPSGPSKGVVLFHGGFDSLIEEFFGVWARPVLAGYEVIAFDGPGQGGARALGHLTFEHDWENPVGAILDHFGVEEAALIGMSMGGYWALRAAAWEPRITRVVSWPPVYDWLWQVGPFARWIVRRLVRLRRFMNWGIRLRMKLFPILDHAVRQAMYLVDSDEPMDAVDWLLAMNRAHLGSERVRADVLLLAGERDTFQPPKLCHHQARALTAAQSIETRTFTVAEHAASHCQMGNLELACNVVTDWLDRHPKHSSVASAPPSSS